MRRIFLAIRKLTRLVALTAAASLAGSALAGEALPRDGTGVTVEYVAHACFVIESPEGVRVAIDPFNSFLWLGYTFPEDPPEADAILITHPHFDHDASYYWPGETPVFRRPGRYSVGDLSLHGVTGRHADPYGKEFGQINTIWILEVAGLRIAHLGDNGPLDDTTFDALGRVDVLMLPVDSTFHILKEDEVDHVLARLQPPWTVPMHYAIPALAEEVQDLGPIDPWLAGRERVHRLDGHRTTLRHADLPAEPSVLVFQHHPSVKSWSAAFLAANRDLDTARPLLGEADDARRREGLDLLRAAVDGMPDAVRFAAILGQQLAGENRAEAIAVLERSLAGARDDWAMTAWARSQLAALYVLEGRRDLAARQYRLVLRDTHQLRLRQQAADFFAAPD